MVSPIATKTVGPEPHSQLPATDPALQAPSGPSGVDQAAVYQADTALEVDYDKLSRDSFNCFVSNVAKTIDARHYQLVLAGGDSGSIMAWLTLAIYEYLNKKAPRVVVLPIYRHSDYKETVLFDNRQLVRELQLPDGEIEHVLLVDDEVGAGTAIRGLLSVLGEKSSFRPPVTVIAEDGGFDPGSITGWQIDFRAPKKRVDGAYNAISYIVPSSLAYRVQEVLGPMVEDLNTKHVMATLLDLPLKEWNDGHPAFTYRHRDACVKQLPDFVQMQREFQAHVRALIAVGPLLHHA